VKIGIFDPYLDDLGGGEKYMMTIASCLSTKHEVMVFWNNTRDVEVLKERFGLDLSKVSLGENIFAPGYSFIKRLLASKAFDVILFLSDGSIPFSLSRKLFIHVQQPLEQFQSTSLKDRFKLSRVNGFFCNSLYTKNFIAKKFDLKTSLLYPPVELHPKPVKKENTILHVGRFRTKNVPIGDYKKQGVMVDIFKKMITAGLKGWKFILAVSVQEQDKDVFEIMRRKTEGFPIEFLINKNNRELWENYNHAKIYWHASGFGENLEKHPEYAEHFGISTVEAMGGGCVPVVINAGGQKEIVTEGENGFLWSSEKELMEKTRRVISDQKLWKQLSENAKIRAKDFSPEKFCLQIEELMKK